MAITGAFGVLGSSAASLAAAEGARLALIDYAAEGESIAEALVLSSVDLSDSAQAEGAMSAIADRYGRLDALLNIAGGFVWEKVREADPTTWERMHHLNVLTALNASRAALPLLRRGRAGRIVNVGSAAALRAGTGMGAYGASKLGVHALTQALAAELKEDGIGVNAVLPSIIDTPANRAAMPAADFSAWVAPDDLARVMLFLASEGARAITGALIPVTGRV